MIQCPDCGRQNLAGEEACEGCGASLYELALPRPKRGVQKKILEGTIAELGPKNAAVIETDRPVAEAVLLMRRRRIGCVLATKKGALAGILTERDLLLEVAGIKDPNRVLVSEVMKAEPKVFRDTDALAFAFHDMAIKGYRHIPIARKDGTLGIVSSRDLLRFLCR